MSGKYLKKPSEKEENKVYLIWEHYRSDSDIFPSMENPPKLLDVHKTRHGANMAEGSLVRTTEVYYLIEIREFKE